MKDNILDEYLKILLGEDILNVPARIFCRRTSETSTEHKETGEIIESGPRTLFGGVAIGDLLMPEAVEDQLILAELIIVPKQIYTVKGDFPSPGKGQRMDQILTGYGLDINSWNSRLK